MNTNNITYTLSVVFLFLMLIGAAFVAAVELLRGLPIAPVLQDLLVGGLTGASTVIGVHVGIQIPTPLAPGAPTKPVSLHEMDTAVVAAVRIPS